MAKTESKPSKETQVEDQPKAELDPIDKAIDITEKVLLSKTTGDDLQKSAQAVLNLAHVKLNKPEHIEERLRHVLSKIRSNSNPTELVQLSQAALNLIGARVMLAEKPNTEKPGAGA